MERKVLGRGLEALIPKRATMDKITLVKQPISQKEIIEKEYTFIKITELKPSSYQARVDISPEEIKELANSIKKQGIIQPLLVRKKHDFYEIIAGSRRFYAAKSLGLKELPAIVRKLDDSNSLICSIMENLQRQDLNPIEEAESFKRLMDEFSYSQEKLQDLLAKDRTTIINDNAKIISPDKIREYSGEEASEVTEEPETILNSEKKPGKVQTAKEKSIDSIKRGKDPDMVALEFISDMIEINPNFGLSGITKRKARNGRESLIDWISKFPDDTE